MALEDNTQGGTLINGIYVYETDVMLNAIGDFGRVPQRISWTWQDLAYYFNNGGQLQKRIRGFRTGNLLGYYILEGEFANTEIFAAVDSCYVFVDSPKNDPPTPDPDERPKPPLVPGMIFKPIKQEDKLSQVEYHYGNLWNEDGSLLLNHYVTESVECYDFKVDVYDKPLVDDCKRRSYSVIFGDYFGRGSTDFGGYDDETLTRAMYFQYRNLLLDGQEKFIISGSEVDSVFIIDVPRDRYKDSIELGSWKFDIGQFEISGSGTTNTGSVSFSASVTTYVDEYYRVSDKPPFSDKKFSIYESGSADEVGLFYPTHGVYVFNANRFGNINISGSTSGKNAYAFYQSISGSSQVTSSYGLAGKSFEFKYTNYFFITAKNFEFNYSNNDTFTSGSDGAFIAEMSSKETAYITTVGLYNDEKELIAVGKISTPIQKDFTEEAAFTVKLEH